MAEFNFENFNQLNGFVTNEIIPSCKQFDSQISELETKIKDCVTVQSMSGNTVQPADFDELKIEGEFIEAQAFAYLAVRSYLNLPISFPETTGCNRPCTGGEIIKNF